MPASPGSIARWAAWAAAPSRRMNWWAISPRPRWWTSSRRAVKSRAWIAPRWRSPIRPRSGWRRSTEKDKQQEAAGCRLSAVGDGVKSHGFRCNARRGAGSESKFSESTPEAESQQPKAPLLSDLHARRAVAGPGEDAALQVDHILQAVLDEDVG